jgi:hypothetical protein
MADKLPDVPDIRTAKGFLSDRGDYFHVFVVPSPIGKGWDVALRIDGSYDSKVQAAQAAEALKARLLAIEDLTHERWYSWG